MAENDEMTFVAWVIAGWVLLVVAIITAGPLSPPARNEGPYPGFDDVHANGQHVDGEYTGNLRGPRRD